MVERTITGPKVGGLVICVGLALGGPVAARIQDYQVARLLSYKTQCEMARLEDRSPKTGPMRFFAECENKTFYPDGIEISCADRDDDRSCQLITKEKNFDQLRLLDRKGK